MNGERGGMGGGGWGLGVRESEQGVDVLCNHGSISLRSVQLRWGWTAALWNIDAQHI